MATFSYENIKFIKHESYVQGIFMKNFYFKFTNEELQTIADFEIVDSAMVFLDVSESKVERKFEVLLHKGLNNLNQVMEIINS